MADNKKKQNQLNIELPEEVSEGTYSNLAIISHSHTEFVVDFIRMVPNVPKAKVKSRIILTPQHAKRLMRALVDNVNKFEKQFGKIDEPEQPPFPPMNLILQKHRLRQFSVGSLQFSVGRLRTGQGKISFSQMPLVISPSERKLHINVFIRI